MDPGIPVPQSLPLSTRPAFRQIMHYPSIDILTYDFSDVGFGEGPNHDLANRRRNKADAEVRRHEEDIARQQREAAEEANVQSGPADRNRPERSNGPDESSNNRNEQRPRAEEIKVESEADDPIGSSISSVLSNRKGKQRQQPRDQSSSSTDLESPSQPEPGDQESSLPSPTELNSSSSLSTVSNLSSSSADSSSSSADSSSSSTLRARRLVRSMSTEIISFKKKGQLISSRLVICYSSGRLETAPTFLVQDPKPGDIITHRMTDAETDDGAQLWLYINEEKRWVDQEGIYGFWEKEIYHPLSSDHCLRRKEGKPNWTTRVTWEKHRKANAARALSEQMEIEALSAIEGMHVEES